MAAERSAWNDGWHSACSTERRLPDPEVRVTRHSRLILSAVTLLASVAAVPTDALAQRRVVRRPVARSVVYVSARPFYRPYYYSPFYYRPFVGYAGWDSWYGGYPYGWYGGYPYGSPFYAQYPYGRYYRDYASSARLQVHPRQAEVFIDGYFVGTVDDFDGWLQRLHVEPGEHELEIFLAGHRTFRQQVLFRPGATLHIEHVMQPLAPGEPEEPRPTPSQARSQPSARRGYPPPAPRRDDPVPPPQRGTPPPDRRVESPDYGAVAIRVQPMDAEVLVNGESWRSPEAGSITLQLSEGTHRIEVRREGFRTYSADIHVKRGETTSLNVSLSRR
jgi:PEGA domain